MDLVSVPDFPLVSGIAELGYARSPFGVALTAEGHHLYDVALTLRGLPDPKTLGDFSVYVAWVTTPLLEPMTKLGVVRNGRTPLATVGLNKFLILVTAEASAEVKSRSGRLVIRGMSPSNLMQPVDVSDLPPGMARTPAARPHEHGGGGWSMPPMHPAVSTMIPGLEMLRPDVAPFLPGSGTAVSSLPLAVPRRVVPLKNGDTLALEAGLVQRTLAGRTFAMYGFNGQYPGPLVRISQGATIVVNFTNRLDMPTAVHWHGVRLDNRFDGVPHVTQELVKPGGTFQYVVRFPDAGIYWYHPHHREDIQQDMGLYGNLLVRPNRSDYYSPVNREEVLILDDILIGENGPVPYGSEAVSHALMGRFGNVFMINGEPRYRLNVKRGEVVRFFLTNASNARPYNLSFGVPMKIVASDLGKFQREEWVESVVIAPAERYVVEARFDKAGTAALTNRVQAIDHNAGSFFAETDTLGRILVTGAEASPDHSAAFQRLRRNADVTADIDRYSRHFDKPVDRELILSLRTKDLPFGLVQTLRLDTGYVNPVEWSGTMPMMDWLSTGRQIEWILRDPSTGQENMAIEWSFRRGDVIKMRLANDRHTLHAMHHPIHIHGQRFLVLARNGVRNDNLVWKDTMLLPAGSTADILVEMSNPGRWMLHCHIAEHIEAGMHSVFEVR
ncbi:MAG: multicopper oxidase family protein [Anaerolineae bacterium]|nr:multicopper oxidase family protein [Gemmatimonadaceae bacterium]